MEKSVFMSWFIWKLIRPFALVMAKNTKTAIDDQLIKATDQVLDSFNFEQNKEEEK